MNRQPLLQMRRLLPLLLGAVVLLAGAIQGWYGRLEFSGDDISYLDVTRMIRIGDWKAALNPLWSIGYPLLLASVRPRFPSTLHGELMAVFFLNIAIYLASYLSFLWLLRTIVLFSKRDLLNTRSASLSPFLLVSATCIFLVAALSFGGVSIIGPDQIVAGIFFLASGLALRFALYPNAKTGFLLGAVLGIGFLAKAIFLPLAAVLLATAFLAQRSRFRVPSAGAAMATFLLFFVSYATALSWAFGRPTYGGSGGLNYAFHVNHLPHWMGWQGGGLWGNPIHPVHLIFDRPPVFAFGEPFHVTYPPQFALVYWYEGYRHFFNLHNAAHAFTENMQFFLSLQRDNDRILFAIAICICIAILLQRDRRRWLMGLLQAWPWYLPAVLGIILYLQLHVEARYIEGFIAVLAVVPLVAIELWGEEISPAWKAVMGIVLIVGTLLTLLTVLREPIRLAIHKTDMTGGAQFKVAQYLQQIGLRDGDKVAVVANGNQIRCTWAYVSGVHVVTGMGNDAYDPKDQVQDLHLFFDHADTRQQVLNVFRQQGAIAVVAPNMPFDINSFGWQRVPETHTWVFRF